jgi:hypothetical protein
LSVYSAAGTADALQRYVRACAFLPPPALRAASLAMIDHD